MYAKMKPIPRTYRNITIKEPNWFNAATSLSQRIKVGWPLRECAQAMPCIHAGLQPTTSIHTGSRTHE